MVFTSCIRCQVLQRGIVLTKMAWNGFLLFPQAFQLGWKGTHWLPQDREDPWNTSKLGWTLRTSSIVLLHAAFVLRLKLQKYGFLTRSEISHHWLKHLTKLLSFSEGDLSSVCNYKLPVLQITPEDSGAQTPVLNVTSLQWIARNLKHLLCRPSGRINCNCSLQPVELCWFTPWQVLLPAWDKFKGGNRLHPVCSLSLSQLFI